MVFANIPKHANMKQIRSVFAYIRFEAKKICEYDAMVCNVNILYGNLKSENSQKLYVHEFGVSIAMSQYNTFSGKIADQTL
jgi:hypothetical protein